MSLSSSDGRTLAVGGPYDKSGIGATWIFVYDGSTYQKLDNKLVSKTKGSEQGKKRHEICMYCIIY